MKASYRLALLGAAALVPFTGAAGQTSTQVEDRMTTVAAPLAAYKPTADQAGVAGTVDAAAGQPGAAPAQMTRDNGAPIGSNRNSLAVGDAGPVLLEDTTLIEKLARFDRERIPERVVHARGTGALGVFRATTDLSDVTKASLFATGKETPVFVRFSTVIHPSGSPEGLRDPRGFAIKFYTDQGNWDLVGNNLPIFFIRDAIQFPDMIHSLKPSPVTNKQDPNRLFEFFSGTPEATNMLVHVYSNLGTPASYRTMDGNGVHAFKLVDKDGKVTWAKFRLISRQGVKNLNGDAANKAPFNYLTDDLYSAIAAGDNPTWDVMLQTMTPDELGKLSYNPFDDTKEWLEVPFRKIGELTLNQVPENFFRWTEQSAFAPANLVPGIEASPDRMLQGRLFSYSDTQRYRVGANVMDLPVNKPRVPVVNNYQDGQLDTALANKKVDVNYFPSVLDPKTVDPSFAPTPYKVDAIARTAPISKTEPFDQAGQFYRSLKPADKADLVKNLAGDLGVVTSMRTKVVMVSYFTQADRDLGARLAKAVKVPMGEVERAVAEYTAAVDKRYAGQP
ncbi:catalase [Novosphingobium chloroacetimidivorans]|uniref:Catalase n=1 Tax=Novosphingobium chloroacetimidivorans TaxID=1428314 RepID=A0A7W7NUW6_9SPHN|nr:catalase [Novosphingobium chloroacetimidivorans]MBB4857586.1 catalase [Novosphingobium chloroacetimidivorans]